MPMHCFKCDTCGKEFDEMLSKEDLDIIPFCPSCDSPDKVRKIFKPVPLKFNGSGFTKRRRG